MRQPRLRVLAGLLLISGLGLLSTGCATIPTDAGNLDLTIPLNTEDPQVVSTGLQILVLMTVLSLSPAILVMLTSFTRIIIVLSFVRSALAVPSVPPNQVLIGLAMFLTFFIMAPTWQAVNASALQPYLNGELDQETALNEAAQPMREFMFTQTRERDIGLFVHMSGLPKPQTEDDIPTYVLIPAFIISELKTAFQMGVIIFIPFMIIDMVVASALMSMGMMMLPPSLISLPFKLLLFVMVDGWHLLVRSLVMSFGVPV